MDENSKIEEISKVERKKIGPIELKGFEVKKFGVSIEYGVPVPRFINSDVFRGIEVFQLNGDKKWKI
jgi:hypothetical protein